MPSQKGDQVMLHTSMLLLVLFQWVLPSRLLPSFGSLVLLCKNLQENLLIPQNKIIHPNTKSIVGISLNTHLNIEPNYNGSNIRYRHQWGTKQTHAHTHTPVSQPANKQQAPPLQRQYLPSICLF